MDMGRAIAARGQDLAGTLRDMEVPGGVVHGPQKRGAGDEGGAGFQDMENVLSPA